MVVISEEDNRNVLQHPVFSTHSHNNPLFDKITFSILLLHPGNISNNNVQMHLFAALQSITLWHTNVLAALSALAALAALSAQLYSNSSHYWACLIQKVAVTERHFFMDIK